MAFVGRPPAPILALALLLVLLAGCSGPPRPRLPFVHPGASASAAPVAGTIDAFVPEAMRFVEEHRGLKFKRPVEVQHLGDSAFARRVVQEQRKDQADTVRQGQVLRALRLLPSGLDVEKAEESLLGADVVGFYDPATKALVVRGDQATLDVRHVVVHELTHSLQDQWFGIDTTNLHLDDDQAAAFSALVEGDAVRIEREYVASLPAAERRRLAASAASGGSPAGVPPVLVEELAFPYAVGPEFVDSVLAARGQAGLDQAFRNRPAATSQVIHPDRFLAGDTPHALSEPAADGPVFDRGKLGELGVDLLLEDLAAAGGLSLAQLAAAAGAWTGDRYVAWTAGARVCVRDRFSASGPALASALGRWAAAHPGAGLQGGAEPVLTSCG